MALRFKFSEEKALEALCWIARQWPDITPFYVAKVLFYAEKAHINAYGRPIIADTFIRMNYGPVPSTIRDFIEGNYLFASNAEEVTATISVDATGRYPKVRALRDARLDLLSESDVECLRDALSMCRPMGFAALSDMTHLERAWLDAEPNQPMDYADFIDDDNPHRDEIIEQALTHAAHGVL